MSPLAGATAVVVGAGAFGLASALRLQLAGASVRLFDPAPLGASASGVAAGMLAPGLEAGLDPASEGHFDLLTLARDMWPDFLALAGAPGSLIDRSGALFLTGEATEPVLARLSMAGVSFEVLAAAAAARLSPGLRLGADSVLFLAGEWRLPPGAALRALAASFQSAGGRIEALRVEAPPEGGLVTQDGRPVEADITVIASGAEAAALTRFAPDLSRLHPIKGQILHFAAGPTEGPIIRTPHAYVTPQPTGAVAGATMEHGVNDRRIDPDTVDRLRAEAERLFPALEGAPAEGRAGVRASTPDGLPIVGRTDRGGTILAVGARRNGWLLAPLVGDLVVRAALGEAPGPVGRSFAPGRFG